MWRKSETIVIQTRTRQKINYKKKSNSCVNGKTNYTLLFKETEQESSHDDS